MRWRDEDGIRWLEAELPGARVAFTTRLGGRSEGDFASLNLSLVSEDDRATVLANRRAVDAALGLEPGRVAMARQVHGAEVLHPRDSQVPSPWLDPGTDLPEADGHVLEESGSAAVVLVADCLPVALAGPRGVAMLHAGWRGLAAGILGEGARAVAATDAAIGPGIGVCCYEVGADVRARFAPLGRGLTEDGRLDLKAVARRLLARAGVERVEDCDLCTSCAADLFFSHRARGPRTGRQAGVAWVTG